MRVEIHNNGVTATINRVEQSAGACRCRILIDIKEKHRCKNSIVGQARNELSVYWLALPGDPRGHAPLLVTSMNIYAENEREQRYFNDWVLLEDPGKYELRLWLVAPLNMGLGQVGLGMYLAPRPSRNTLFHRKEKEKVKITIRSKDTTDMSAWEKKAAQTIPGGGKIYKVADE